MRTASAAEPPAAPGRPAAGAEGLEARVWRALRGVRDPEIPVLDVVEMGIVRAVEVSGEHGAAGGAAGDARHALDGSAEAADAAGETRNAAGARTTVRVILTPTFSACPAIHEIERGVRQAVSEAVDAVSAGAAEGAGERLAIGVEVVTRLWPPWSSDDMTEAARAKLERFGIAPAPPHGGLIELALDAPVRCPRCGHPDTRLRNPFGSALCREIRTCQACDETFERFKPL